MGSEFLSQKYEWLFGFFDNSKNGSIDMNDFIARAERVTESIKQFYEQQEGGQVFIDENIEKIREAQRQAHEEFFNHLCSEIDKSGDARISTNEWFAFCDKIREHVSATGTLPEWFGGILNNYYDNVLDFDGSGYIDLYELSFMGDAPLDVAWYCFNFLTEGGQKPLTKEAFVNYTSNYLSNDDPSDPSRYMFGFVQLPAQS
ncbi:hypothetical protein ACOME3_001309 [Neoechinorhynchus agilis]